MNYFESNPHAIKQALEEGKFKEVFSEFESIRKTYSDLREAQLRINREKEVQLHITTLKDMDSGAELYYTSTGSSLFGKKCTKIKDLRKYMLVWIEKERWKIPYKSLQVTPPNEGQKISRAITTLINK